MRSMLNSLYSALNNWDKMHIHFKMTAVESPVLATPSSHFLDIDFAVISVMRAMMRFPLKPYL